jgi:hypothetical protein
MQQFDRHGIRRYQHFMSGDWVWIQAVRHSFISTGFPSLSLVNV